jgi:glycerol-3-phosphate acyltransferase PlsY
MNAEFAQLLGLIAVAYLCAAIPFALLIGKAKGVDLRQHGSGNIGATNAWRILGRPYGLAVFALDFLKGFLPVFVAGSMLYDPTMRWGNPDAGINLHLMWVLVAAACVIGHVFPIYLKFKGGKGVATSLGVLIAIYPYFTVAALIAFVLWAVVTYATHFVSLGSVTAAIAFPITFAVVAAVKAEDWADQPLWPLHVFAIIMAALVVWRHRTNLAHLVRGKESKVGEP